MPFEDGSLGAICDKGTLDAICCGDGFDYEAGLVAAECVRCLRPGGRWVCISLMPGTVVLPLFKRQEWASLDSKLVQPGVFCHTAVRG